MKPKHSTHAAGSAAYTRNSSSSEGAESTPSGESGKTDPGAEPTETTFQKTAEEGLSAQERQMIEKQFPEDPELSMRLYGQERGTSTVRGRAVGENIDVVG